MRMPELSNQVFQEIFRLSPTPVIMVSREKKVLAMNLQGSSMLGLSEEECLGKVCEEVIYRNNGRCANCPLIEQVPGNGPFSTAPYISGDNRFSVMVVPLENGNVMAHYFSKEPAEKLTETARNLADNYFQAAPIGMGIIKQENFLAVNSWFSAITGYSAGEISGKSLQLLFDSNSSYENFRTHFPAGSKGEPGKGMEFKWRCRDGSLKEVLLSFSPMHVGENNSDGQMFSVIDISDQKSKESARQRRENTILKIQAGISSQVGERFFETMVTEMVSALGCTHAFIGQLSGSDRIETMAVCRHGKIAENFQYMLANTPCEQVIKTSICSFPNNVSQLFDKDVQLKKLNIEGYIGVALSGSASKSVLGIMVALYEKPVEELEIALAILSIFSSRAGAEIERLQNEQLLAISEKRYRLLFEGMIDGFAYCRIVTGPDGKTAGLEYLEVNPAFERLTGSKKETFTIKTGTLLFPELNAMLITMADHGQNQGSQSQLEYYDRSLNRHFEIAAYFPGKRYLAAIISDISDRKSFEENLRRERDFNALISQTTPVGLVYLNRSGEIIFANPLAEKLLEIKDAEQPHLRRSSVKLNPGQHGNAEMPIEMTVFKLLRESRSNLYGLQQAIISSQGETIYLSMNASPLFSGSPELTGAVITFDNITKEIMAEQELIQAKEKAVESDKLKSAFLANISHEIRTPMNGIMGFSSLLDNASLDPAKRTSYTKIIRDRCNDLLHIVDDLLDLSKIEAGHMDLFAKKFSLNYMIDDLYLQYSQKLVQEGKEQLGLLKEIGLATHNDTLLADESRLRQVLCNLLDNAVKFTEKGSIIFGYSHSLNKLTFFVEDTGIGIEPGKKEIIFERFRQGEESMSKNYGGAGLGLSISKSLVELMGGTIQVDSKPKKGSIFRFSLPAELLLEEQGPIVAEPRKAEGLKVIKRLLVVEDDEYSKLYLKELFTAQEFECFYAMTGREALDLIQSGIEPDLVLMDIRLPDISGLEVTRAIKVKRPTLPVIALTAYAMEEDKKRCLAAGCDDYISKPVFKEQLLEKLTQLLRK